MSRWAVVGVPDQLRHGGDLRARHVFRALTTRTNALSFYRPNLSMLGRAARHPESLLPGVNVAAAELLPGSILPAARRITRLRVLDLHDHPVLQAEAFDLPIDRDTRFRMRKTVSRNIDSFERVVVQTNAFGDLCDVPLDRRIVIPNGADTTVIQARPLPDRPHIGMISGAAPGRGIEHLVQSIRLVRDEIPDVTLALGLVTTGVQSEAYLKELVRELRRYSWVQILDVPYFALTKFLGECELLAIPHPKNAYMDAVLPVKLFDSMAAGRAVVSTPRTATRELLERYDAGFVSAGDSRDDYADLFVRALSNPKEIVKVGNNAREAALFFDWRRLSHELAEQVLPPVQVQ